MVTGIESSGVQVIGDIDALRVLPGDVAPDREGQAAAADDAVVAVPPEVVAALSMGLLEATGVTTKPSRSSRLGTVESFARRAARLGRSRARAARKWIA